MSRDSICGRVPFRWRIGGRNGDRVTDPGFARTCQRQFMQSRSKHGAITCTLRGCADRQHGQKRERHDRAKWANPSKQDTSANAVTRHHRCSSIRQGLMRNVSQEAPSRLQWITARISNSIPPPTLPCHSPRKRGMTLRNESVSSAPLQHVPLSRKIREQSFA